MYGGDVTYNSGVLTLRVLLPDAGGSPSNYQVVGAWTAQRFASSTLYTAPASGQGSTERIWITIADDGRMTSAGINKANTTYCGDSYSQKLPDGFARTYAGSVKGVIPIALRRVKQVSCREYYREAGPTPRVEYKPAFFATMTSSPGIDLKVTRNSDGASIIDVARVDYDHPTSATRRYRYADPTYVEWYAGGNSIRSVRLNFVGDMRFGSVVASVAKSTRSTGVECLPG